MFGNGSCRSNGDFKFLNAVMAIILHAEFCQFQLAMLRGFFGSEHFDFRVVVTVRLNQYPDFHCSGLVVHSLRLAHNVWFALAKWLNSNFMVLSRSVAIVAVYQTSQVP
jgi:hypothetical protein